MQNKKTQFVRAIVFLIVLSVVISVIQQRFVPYDQIYTDSESSFYELPEDSVDILIIGTSSIWEGLSPLILYDELGVTSYVRGSARQNAQVTYLNLKESLNTQSPDIVVCGVMSMITEYDIDENESWLRMGFDYKKLSFDKIEVAKAIVEESNWQTLQSYIFPIARYHSRWLDALKQGKSGTKGEYSYTHGQYALFVQRVGIDVSEQHLDDATEVELIDDAMIWYQKIADLCEKENIELIFVAMPRISWTLGSHNAVSSAAEKLGGMAYIDYNYNGIMEEYGIDYATDFYDPYHLNARGSVKATKYLAKYLKDNCNVGESEISDSHREQYEDDLARFKYELETVEFEKLQSN